MPSTSTRPNIVLQLTVKNSENQNLKKKKITCIGISALLYYFDEILFRSLGIPFETIQFSVYCVGSRVQHRCFFFGRVIRRRARRRRYYLKPFVRNSCDPCLVSQWPPLPLPQPGIFYCTCGGYKTISSGCPARRQRAPATVPRRRCRQCRRRRRRGNRPGPV